MRAIATSNTSEKNYLFTNPLAWLMWLLGALFYFYEFLLQVSPSVMVSELMRDFDVTAQHIGYFAAIYFWTYAPMQMIVGILLDRFGPHRLLTAAAGCCAIGTLVFANTNHFYMALFGRALIGLGSAFAIVGCMKIVVNWFPKKQFALMLGLVLTIGMMGAMAGQAPLKILMEHFNDWRRSMYLLAIAGLVLMIIMLLVLRDRPDQALTEDHPPPSKEPGIVEGLAIILRNPQSWLTAIYGGLMFAPTSVLASFVGVKFIVNAYQVSDVEASSITLLMFVGWAIGSPLVGWFSDKINRRLPSMYLGTLLATLLMCLILYVPMPQWLLGCTFFAFGFASSGFLMAFPIIKEINPPKYNATALGYMNTINMLGGAMLPPLIGTLLDVYWTGDKYNGEPLYSMGDYQIALSVLPLILLISLFFIPFIRETFCHDCYESTESKK